jgi:hypothetical protein
MAASDYMPQKEGDLVPWAENFIEVANANLATLGLTAPDITTLTTKKTDNSTSLNNAIAKQAESKAATDNKNIKKDALKDNIRVLVRQIQARPGVPDNLKVQLGLKPADPVHTPSGPFPPLDTTVETLEVHQFRVKWNRNGNSQGTIFLIETAILPDGPWQILGTTTKTTFDTNHSNPAGPTFFRVKAQKGDLISEAGNVVGV